MNNKRIEWIDRMRGVCMIFVILHHSGAPLEYQKLLSPFFLSGFFFISGYLFDKSDKVFDFKLKLIRIIETLIVPYFIYWAITYFLKIDYIEFWHNINLDIFVSFFYEIISGKKLWFMSALIVSEIVLALILPIIRENKFYLFVTSIFFLCLWFFTPFSKPGILLPWYINNACIAIFFMLCGVIVRKIRILENDIILYIAFVSYIIMYIIDLIYDINNIMFASNYFNNIFVFIFYAIVGIFALVCLCKKDILNTNLLGYYGRNSLLVYFFCNQIIILSMKLTASFYINWYIKSLIITIIVCFLISIPVYLSNKFLPWMSGRFNILSTLYQKKK